MHLSTALCELGNFSQKGLNYGIFFCCNWTDGNRIEIISSHSLTYYPQLHHSSFMCGTGSYTVKVSGKGTLSIQYKIANSTIN